MSRQFVAVEFRSGGRKYTYHNDGDPVAAGALVKVPDRSGDGWQRATVVTAFADPPAFATKAILGRLEPGEMVAEPPRQAPAGEPPAAPRAQPRTLFD
jgi:hypothetical protein